MILRRACQAARDPVFVPLSPIAGLLFETTAENLLDSGVFTTFNPILNERLPGVFVVTLLLLLCGCCAQFR